MQVVERRPWMYCGDNHGLRKCDNLIDPVELDRGLHCLEIQVRLQFKFERFRSVMFIPGLCQHVINGNTATYTDYSTHTRKLETRAIDASFARGEHALSHE